MGPGQVRPPTLTDVPAAREAPERDRTYAAARHAALARSAIARDARRIVDPPRLKFLFPASGCEWKCNECNLRVHGVNEGLGGGAAAEGRKEHVRCELGIDTIGRFVDPPADEPRYLRARPTRYILGRAPCMDAGAVHA